MTSYAYGNRAALPGRASTLDTSELSKAHAEARDNKQLPARPSTMVTKDSPQPQPHPSPDMAHEVDRACFDQRWNDEARAARKAAFIAKRNAETQKRPEATLRDGSVKASIWRNEGDSGAFRSTTFARTYEDRDGNPRDAISFAGTDLLKVSELARQAYNKSRTLDREERRAAFKEIVRSLNVAHVKTATASAYVGMSP